MSKRKVVYVVCEHYYNYEDSWSRPIGVYTTMAGATRVCNRMNHSTKEYSYDWEPVPLGGITNV